MNSSIQKSFQNMCVCNAEHLISHCFDAQSLNFDLHNFYQPATAVFAMILLRDFFFNFSLKLPFFHIIFLTCALFHYQQNKYSSINQIKFK